MLKNKFGMLKVLALALSVLMLVSLAACGNQGVAKEDMDSAIAAALAEQSKAEASKQAALESSLAAAQAAAESERKAVESSLAAAAAEADKKAEEASKAAASAEKKASEEASKAAASAAEASKAAASISASISKSQADAAKTSQSTTAPIVADKAAIAAVQAEFAKLRHEYTYTNEDLYLADNYAELTLLFDKAAVELQNALTKEAAESVLATLKVEVAAIENAQSRADAVQALVAALGDIETEVFTTQAEKITEAREAYTAFTTDYNKKSGMDQELLNAVIDETITVADLEKAEAKLAVLNAYIKASLNADMQKLYDVDDRMRYDAERDINKVISGELTYGKVIADAHYKYNVLAVINGGDFADADLAVEFENKKDPETGRDLVEDGKKVPDTDKPTKWFTIEDLLNVYILPTVDYKFDVIKGNFVTELTDALAAAYTKYVGSEDLVYVVDIADDVTTADKNEAVKITAIVPETDVQDVFEDAVEAFEEALAEKSYVADYKGNATLDDAVADVYALYTAAYVNALFEVVEVSKDPAIDAYTEYVYEARVEYLEGYYTEENQVNVLNSNLAIAADTLETFTTNVNDAPIYDFDALNTASLLKEYGLEDIDLTDMENIEEFYSYVSALFAKSFKNFAVNVSDAQDGILGVIATALIKDLRAFQFEWTDEDGAYYESIQGAATTHPWTDEVTYKNTAKIAALNEAIEDAIDAILAVEVADYSDSEVQIKWKDANGDSWKKKALYFISADAKDHYAEMGYTEADMVDFDLMKQYFGTTNTGLAYTYTHTAEEKACQEIENIYLEAYKTINEEICSMMGYSKTYTEKITKKGTAFYNVQQEVKSNEALKAEVDKFGSAYTGDIATAVSGDGFYRALGLAKASAVYDFVAKSDTITAGKHVTLKYDPTAEQKCSNQFSLENITTYLQGIADTCNANAAKVSTLWAYKHAAVEAVTAAVNAAKYTYTVDEAGKTVANGNVTYAYNAVVNGVKSPAAGAYEAALDSLLTAAKNEIMAVTMDNTEKADYKNWAGAKLWSEAKIAYSYDNAVKYIDAIVANYVGTIAEDGTVQTVTMAGEEYINADSKIFEAFKINIKNNYNSWGSLTTGTKVVG